MNANSIKEITTEDIYKAVSFISSQESKQAVLVTFNRRNKVINVHTIGYINNSIVDTRELTRKALLDNATSVAVAHNSLEATPKLNADDIQCTMVVKDACKTVGLELLDFLVVGKDDYLSMRSRHIL